MFLKHGIFIIKGYIRHNDDISSENILKLNEWTRMSGDKLEWLKRINLKIVRGGYVIREFVFNGFVADYMEYFNKGRHMFNLVIRQYKLKVLEGTGDTGADNLSSYVGNIKIKNVKVSRFGRQLQPKKYIGLTPVKATALFVKDMGLDIYATKEGFKAEIEKRNKSYPTISNITIPKNTDMK